MKKISVIMPVYNTEKEYLCEAIESILNQTYKDFDFIIINDGSSNNDVEDVILSYNDERIKYYKNEKNMGLPYTRNKCLDLAKTEFVAFMDSDDVSLPNRIEKQLKYLEEHKNVIVLASWFNYINPENNLHYDGINYDYFDLIKWCPWICNPTVMIRKNIFDLYSIRYNLEFGMAEDYELFSRAIRYGKIHIYDEVLLNYRNHPNNSTNTRKKEMIEKTKEVRNNLLFFLTKDKEKQKDIESIVNANCNSSSSKRYVKIFNFIPFLKIIEKNNIFYCKIFNFIPLLKINKK